MAYKTKPIYFLVFLSLFFSTADAAAEKPSPKVISFHCAEEFEHSLGMYVELRGFYSEQHDARRLISALPNLKSCCVGSAALRQSQVLLEGDFKAFSPHKVITVRGYLQLNPERECAGEPFYILYTREFFCGK